MSDEKPNLQQVEYLTEDDLAYLKDTVAEVNSLQSSANTLLNFANARLAKKYGITTGGSLNPETGQIVRPKPALVKDAKEQNQSAS